MDRRGRWSLIFIPLQQVGGALHRNQKQRSGRPGNTSNRLQTAAAVLVRLRRLVSRRTVHPRLRVLHHPLQFRDPLPVLSHSCCSVEVVMDSRTWALLLPVVF